MKILKMTAEIPARDIVPGQFYRGLRVVEMITAGDFVLLRLEHPHFELALRRHWLMADELVEIDTQEPGKPGALMVGPGSDFEPTSDGRAELIAPFAKAMRSFVDAAKEAKHD